MQETVRIYGKTLETWHDECGRIVQYEIAYREFDATTGEIVGAGSEDFSTVRYRMSTTRAWVWTWDGRRRNRGGHRRFECRGYVTFRSSERTALRKYLRVKYPDADAIDIRRF